jgi:hypothetical protein
LARMYSTSMALTSSSWASQGTVPTARRRLPETTLVEPQRESRLGLAARSAKNRSIRQAANCK